MGAFLPWLDGDEAGELLTVNAFTESVEYFGQLSTSDSPEYDQLARAAAPFLRAGFLVLAAFMLFGLTGTSGKLTRVAALLTVLTMMAGIIAYSILVDAGGLARGALIVVFGGIIGFAGGLLVKR